MFSNQKEEDAQYAQIRLKSDPATPNELAVHRLEDGGTGCGKTLKSLNGQPAVLVPISNADLAKVVKISALGYCRGNGCWS